MDEPALVAVEISDDLGLGGTLQGCTLVDTILLKRLDQFAVFKTFFDGTAASLQLPGHGEAICNSASAPQKMSREERVAKVVQLNAFLGTGCPILESAEGRDLHGVAGLWPSYSLINHSCVPNAISYVVGRRMVVRAAKSISEGEEVTLSYLGPQGLRLLPYRQEELRRFEFKCRCPRCSEEDRQQDSAISKVLGEVQEHMEGMLKPMVVQATAMGARDLLEEVSQMVDDAVQRVTHTVEGSGVRPEVQRYLLGGMVGLFQMRIYLDRILNPQDPTMTNHLLAVLEEVACGSSLHVSCAADYLNLIRLSGDVEKLEQQKARCYNAFVARYGPLGEPQYSKLLGSCLSLVSS